MLFVDVRDWQIEGGVTRPRQAKKEWGTNGGLAG